MPAVSSVAMPLASQPEASPYVAPRAAGAALPAEVPASRYLTFAGIALGGCLLDLYSKWWMFANLGMPGEQPGIWPFPGVFGFQTSLNEGALFGMGQGQGTIFIGLSLVATAAVIYWLFVQKAAAEWWTTIALGGVMAGVLGNLYDRLGIPALAWNYPEWRVGQPVYAVRDWIYFKLIEWPVFNIADSLLVCGCLMLAWQAFFAPQETAAEPAVQSRST